MWQWGEMIVYKYPQKAHPFIREVGCQSLSHLRYFICVYTVNKIKKSLLNDTKKSKWINEQNNNVELTT